MSPVKGKHHVYLQLLPLGLSGGAALAAGQVDEVYAAGDSVVVLFPIHKLRL